MSSTAWLKAKRTRSSWSRAKATTPFLARIGIQADADIVVFDDYYTFRQAFKDAGVFPRTVMLVKQASDPQVERLLVPDIALAITEKFAVEEGKRVLVLLTDMTAYADAMKEAGISQKRVPSNRVYGRSLQPTRPALRKSHRLRQRRLRQHPHGDHYAWE